MRRGSMSNCQKWPLKLTEWTERRENTRQWHPTEETIWNDETPPTNNNYPGFRE